MFESKEFYLIFLRQLNIIYCAKSHLVERFSEIIEDDRFGDLVNYLEESQANVAQESIYLENIFVLLEEKINKNCFDYLSSIQEDIFTVIQLRASDKVSRDVGLWIYMEHIKTLEILSNHMACLIDRNLQHPLINSILKQFRNIKRDNSLSLILAANCVEYGVVL